MIRRLVSRVLLALLLPGLLAGCSGRGAPRDAARGLRTAEDSLADWRVRADSLDASLGSLEQVRGQLEQASGTSTYAAWFESGDVRIVHEELALGPRGSRSNRYYFEGGAPRLAVETGRVPVDTTLALGDLERAMLFDPSGRLVAASKTVAGVRTWVATYEATAAANHALLLRTTAWTARASRGAMAPPGGGTPAKR